MRRAQTEAKKSDEIDERACEIVSLIASETHVFRTGERCELWSLESTLDQKKNRGNQIFEFFKSNADSCIIFPKIHFIFEDGKKIPRTRTIDEF